MPTTEPSIMGDVWNRRGLRVRTDLGLENKDVTHHVARSGDDGDGDGDSIKTTSNEEDSTSPEPETPIVYAAPTASPTSVAALALPADRDGSDPVMIVVPNSQEGDEQAEQQQQQSSATKSQAQPRNSRPLLSGIVFSLTSLLVAGLVVATFLVRRKRRRRIGKGIPLHKCQDDETDEADEGSDEQSKTSEDDADVDTEASVMHGGADEESIEFPGPAGWSSLRILAVDTPSKDRSKTASDNNVPAVNQDKSTPPCADNAEPVHDEVHFFGDVGAVERHMNDSSSTSMDLNHVLLNAPRSVGEECYDLQVVGGVNFLAPGDKEI